MTTTYDAKPASRVLWVDRFLALIRFVFIFVISVGLLAFIAQQINPQNPFAQWINPDATGLTAPQFKGLLVTGLAQGAMYGLIALGYSMVYGVLGFINFAHGEVFMVGAMSGMITSNKLADAGLWEDAFLFSLLFVVVSSIVLSTATAVIMERIAYRPLRGSPRLIPLITSIGVSFFLQNLSVVLLGPGAKSYPALPSWLSQKRSLLGFDIEGTKLVVLVTAAVSMAGLWFLVERTKTGRAMRAVAEDKEIAALMGIDVNRTIVTTFAVGGAMAGVAGILWGILFRSVIHTTGFLPGIKAFSAAVVGGIGNLGGAMAGGLSLGAAEATAPLLLLEPLGVDGVSQLRDAVAFAVLIFVLLVRPSGLFGERLSEEERA
ncbi:MAG: branched-chain amino acid ABC transporter permease [Actinomycetota bacterium]|nr:branched-chain amino acid ABC transporter permease [Acidimicrobiales bacterium]MEC7873383.1 branched-chain amino acid ABC transporter permease [Actinomycetota bacterium]MEC9269207.1 branched-chain amino acid ABC transporter permease [Actinomycetota bacterium]MEC9315795.1 branched-chain amino acid ABC transporter permease [Actinomycetota bacterium]MED6304568.1 branched-chain amino acid ABC transporter permease [Actinomycetota bacterium]